MHIFQKTKVIYGFVTKIGTFLVTKSFVYIVLLENALSDATESGACGANILENHVQQIHIFACFICT